MSAVQAASAILTTEPVDVAVLQSAVVGQGGNGAIVTFDGVVRDLDNGHHVTSLTYEAHPSAAAVLDHLVGQVRERHPYAHLAVAHRVGDLAIGDTAFAVVAASAHREEAFTACRDAVETIKELLPVWKLQRFTDGTDEWVHGA